MQTRSLRNRARGSWLQSSCRLRWTWHIGGTESVFARRIWPLRCSWRKTYAPADGQLDVVLAPRLEGRLDQLRRDGARLITLDLSGVEFLAAAGLSVFIGADQAQQAAGGQLLLTRPTRMAGHVLAMTGLDTMVSLPCAQ